MNIIGNLKESSLHASLKKHYANSGDFIEAILNGYIVDVKRNDEIVEIQTGNFSQVRKKISLLLDDYHVRVVLPIAIERYILRIDTISRNPIRRRSPKRGRIEDLFIDLVGLAGLASHPNFILDVVFVKDEIRWLNDGRGSWRRRNWSIKDRILLEIIETKTFSCAHDYIALLPFAICETFTSQQLARSLGINVRLANKMLYCLKSMNLVNKVGKIGRAFLYELNPKLNNI